MRKSHLKMFFFVFSLCIGWAWLQVFASFDDPSGKKRSSLALDSKAMSAISYTWTMRHEMKTKNNRRINRRKSILCSEFDLPIVAIWLFVLNLEPIHLELKKAVKKTTKTKISKRKENPSMEKNLETTSNHTKFHFGNAEYGWKKNIEAVFLHFKSSAIFVESQSHLCKHKTCSVWQDCFNETNRHNKRNLSIWLIPVPLQLWINQRPNGGLRLCSYRWSIFGYISDAVLPFFRCCKISIRFLIKHSAEHCSLKINHSEYLAGLFVFGAYVLSIK